MRYVDKNGEYLWINLRNPLHEQLVPGNRPVMEMRVKYFVKPQKLLQPVTRLVGFLSLSLSFFLSLAQTQTHAHTHTHSLLPPSFPSLFPLPPSLLSFSLSLSLSLFPLSPADHFSHTNSITLLTLLCFWLHISSVVSL